jgi:mono/diheme cytochrome c family protein
MVGEGVMFRLAAAWIVALLAPLAVLGCEGWGEGGAALIETDDARAEVPEAGLRIERGHEWYTEYCGACHGATGHGNGLASSELEKPPADLTRIALRNSGAFDAPSVAAFIDGRYRQSEDGPRDMPVWGRRFDDRNESLLRDETRLAPGAILLIVEYLDSIQVEPEGRSGR